MSGKVSVLDGKTKVGTGKLKKGKVAVKVERTLQVGSHTLAVCYPGDGYTAKGVSKALKVTVTK